jgi:hypothetical protein
MMKAEGEDEERQANRLPSGRHPVGVQALIEAHRDEPHQHHQAENGEQFLVGCGLVGLNRRAHALGQERRIAFCQPPATGKSDDDHKAEIGPRAGPVQRAGRHEQQHGEGNNPGEGLEQPFRDHSASSSMGTRSDRRGIRQIGGVSRDVAQISFDAFS